MKDNTPLYRYPGSHAREHGELEQYRASNRANLQCKESIEAAIRDHYRDNRLDPAGARQVLDDFGSEKETCQLTNMTFSCAPIPGKKTATWEAAHVTVISLIQLA